MVDPKTGSRRERAPPVTEAAATAAEITTSSVKALQEKIMIMLSSQVRLSDSANYHSWDHQTHYQLGLLEELEKVN